VFTSTGFGFDLAGKLPDLNDIPAYYQSSGLFAPIRDQPRIR
jgi:hypothetical protein